MTLAARVVRELKQRGLTLACAESCTGGLVADAIVSVPGASEVFRGGLVAYDTSIKISVLGVSKRALKNGAVSEECAADMAKKARKLFGADIAISTTGYADKSDRPDVQDGTIFVAIAFKNSVALSKYVFKKSRNANRKAALEEALKTLLKNFS